MLTSDECLATAQELASMAMEAPSLAESLLEMAEEWNRLALVAQSNGRVSEAVM
jgi:hypothetical protein